MTSNLCTNVGIFSYSKTFIIGLQCPLRNTHSETRYSNILQIFFVARLVKRPVGIHHKNMCWFGACYFSITKKHVRVNSIFLLYLPSPFLKKVLYEIKEILSICLTQEIMGEK